MKKSLIKRLVLVLFILYIAVLFVILFLYSGRIGNPFGLSVFSKEHLRTVNYLPFKTILSYFKRLREHTINDSIVIKNLAANLLMFVPMGMALPVLSEKRFNKGWKVVGFTAVLVLLVEIMQFITFSGSADIDDLLLNVTGAAVGYAVLQIPFIRKLLKLS